MSVWRNLNTENSANLRILTEPCKNLANHVRSAELGLKNTGIERAKLFDLIIIC